MTTMCTDRTLPDAINDYSVNGTSWFRTIAEWNSKDMNLVVKHNDSGKSGDLGS